VYTEWNGSYSGNCPPFTEPETCNRVHKSAISPWAKWMQPTTSVTIPLRSTLISFPHRLSGVPCGLFLSGLPTKPSGTSRLSCAPRALWILFLLLLLIDLAIHSAVEHNLETPIHLPVTLTPISYTPILSFLKCKGKSISVSSKHYAMKTYGGVDA
jgi:hypothetical protein